MMNAISFQINMTINLNLKESESSVEWSELSVTLQFCSGSSA